MAVPVDESPASASYRLPVRTLVATVSLCAGTIHLAMVPSHAQESAVLATGFAIVGWFQVVTAVWLVARPGRGLLQGMAAVNALAVAAWLMSRTAGLPLSGEAGAVEDFTTIDLWCGAFEVAVVVGALALAVRPDLGARLTEGAGAVLWAASVLALVATSLALADPTTADHAHNDDETALDALQVAARDRCDLGLNPVSYWSDTTQASIDTLNGGAGSGGAGVAASGSADGHDHGAASTEASPSTTAALEGSPELDRLIAASARSGGEMKDAEVVVALAEASDDAYQQWLRWLPTYTAGAHAAAAASGTGDDNGGHGGHLGPQPWTVLADQAECDELSAQLDQARTIALDHPTAADATAAGWVRVTPYVPGIAAHYMNFAYVDDTFDVSQPEMLLYDGNGPDASIVGLSYYLLHDSDLEPTQGFSGPEDHFHRHVGLCVGAGGVIGDSATSAEDCAARGGFKAEGTGGWMNHVWIVPGCESPWGMFSGANPLLDETLAERSGTDGGGCAGSGVRERYDLSPGTEANTPATVRGAEEVAAGG